MTSVQEEGANEIESIVVEYGKSKFGKRKYNTGHWVGIVGVERTTAVAVAVQDRIAAIIRARIKE